MEEIGKDKVLEIKFEFYMAQGLSYIVTKEKGGMKQRKAISMFSILIKNAEYLKELLNMIKMAEKQELGKSEKDKLMKMVKDAKKQTDPKLRPPPEELVVMGKPKLVEMMDGVKNANMQELDKSEKDKKQEEVHLSLPSYYIALVCVLVRLEVQNPSCN